MLDIFKKPDIPRVLTTAEIHEQILKDIESSGTGRCLSYDLKSEVDMVRNKTSKLSARQRGMLLYQAEKYRL